MPDRDIEQTLWSYVCGGGRVEPDGEDTSEEHQLRDMKPGEILDVNWLVSGFSSEIEQE